MSKMMDKMKELSLEKERKAVATAEFGMEAEDILGYVFEYRFDMEKKCSFG